MNIIGIIPARYASTRFEGKPLIDIAGKTMIQRVYEQAQKAKTLAKIVVATDDERIAEAVRAFGGNVLMTPVDCQNGTERCAAALEMLHEQFDAVVNVQGDEPFIAPEQIDALTRVLLQQDCAIATLARKILSVNDLHNPNIVKVVRATTGLALYFSRHAVPYLRGGDAENALERHVFLQHIGLYAYRADRISTLAHLRPTPLEQAESLEQLRWLESGFSIGVALTEHVSMGVDTPDDWQKAIDWAIGNNL